MLIENNRTCPRCGRPFHASGVQRVCNSCRAPLRGNYLYRAGAALSSREKQVVCLVAEGKQNKEIAWDLKLTEGTIKQYMNHIYTKTGAKNRTQLAVRHVANG